MIKSRVLKGLLPLLFLAAGEGQTLVDLRTQAKSVDFSAANSTKPMQTGTSLPASCAVGQLFFLTTAAAGSNVYACNPANSWTVQGTSFAVSSGSANEVASSNGSSLQWLALGGDIAGAPNAVTVEGLRGRAVGNAAPTNGQVLKWNAATNQWLPSPGQTGNPAAVFTAQTTVTILGTTHQLGSNDLIVECYDNSSPPQRVEADHVQINPTTYDVTIVFSTPQTGYCVVNGAGTAGSGGSGGASSVGGDLSGTTSAATVTGIQNRSVASTAPANGQGLIWNSAASNWQPGAISSNISSVFGRTGAVTAQTGDYSFAQIAGTISATQLPLGISATDIGAGSVTNTTFGYLSNVTSDIQAQLNGKTPLVHTDPLTGDVSGNTGAAVVVGLQSRALSSTAPSNGQALVWNSAGALWQPGTIAGNVSSVFGRSGAITAQSGDYSFGQISGTVGSAQLPAAGGDIGGALTTATVTGIQSRAVANTAPVNGQALVWNSSASQWQPSNVGGGSGGGGAAMAYQLGDLIATLTSSTVLSIGANCGPSAPCNVRFGYQVISITSGATATISGTATGAAYIYVNSAGGLVVGHNLTVACSGCSQQPGITAFPANVIPVAIWTATNGTWDSAGGRDQRAFLSAKAVVGGQGIVITEAPGQTTVTVDNGVIPTYLMNSATLAFPNIANGACAADMSLTVTGANVGDSVSPGWPSGLPAGIMGIMFVNGSNTVTVRLCNFSGASVQPPSASYKATIVRNY